MPACDPHGHTQTGIEKYSDIDRIFLFGCFVFVDFSFICVVYVFVYMHVCIYVGMCADDSIPVETRGWESFSMVLHIIHCGRQVNTDLAE